MEKLERLYQKLGYAFKRSDLLSAALTHRSQGGVHNERLEFLGDAFLSFTIATELYKRFPKVREGDLTRMRALLVRGETLAQIARELTIGEYLHLGVGERKSGGHMRSSILSDALEAIIGAIYLDGGVEVCQTRVLVWYEQHLDALLIKMPEKDAKTRLQEYCQTHGFPLPKYEIVEVLGEAHEPIFKVQCRVSSINQPFIGMANVRRKAEQAAAEAALEELKNGR